MTPFHTTNGVWTPDVEGGYLVFRPMTGELSLVDLCEVNVAAGLKPWSIPPTIKIDR